MRISGKKIIVIGGGIGGLAAALALSRFGAAVTVLEQAAEISDMGAGLQISPNGFAVLDALGLRDAVIDRSMAATSLVLRNYSDSATVATLDISTGKDGQNYYFIHRADLVACLLSAARQTGVQVRLQHKVKQVQTSVIPQVVLDEWPNDYGRSGGWRRWFAFLLATGSKPNLLPRALPAKWRGERWCRANLRRWRRCSFTWGQDAIW